MGQYRPLKFLIFLTGLGMFIGSFGYFCWKTYKAPVDPGTPPVFSTRWTDSAATLAAIYAAMFTAVIGISKATFGFGGLGILKLGSPPLQPSLRATPSLDTFWDRALRVLVGAGPYVYWFVGAAVAGVDWTSGTRSPAVLDDMTKLWFSYTIAAIAVAAGVPAP